MLTQECSYAFQNLRIVLWCRQATRLNPSRKMSDADGGKSHFEGREIAFQIKGNLSFIPFLSHRMPRADRKAARKI